MADLFAVPSTQGDYTRTRINAAGLSTADLVTRARGGDWQAWEVLVERFAPLIRSICRRYRLGPDDAADACQYVWLRLVDRLGTIRDPAAVAGWLVTTTERECVQVLRAARRPEALRQVLDAENVPDEQIGMVEHEVLVAERYAAFREALARLPLKDRRLMALLVNDPPMPYAEISARLGIPVGSIGPSRARCLEKLRRDPVIAALMNAEPESEMGNTRQQAM